MTDGSLTMIDHLIDVLIKLQERRLRRPRLKTGPSLIEKFVPATSARRVDSATNPRSDTFRHPSKQRVRSNF